MVRPRMTAADLGAAAISSIAAAWAFVESARWPAPEFVGGPSLVPRVIAVILIVASATLAWRAFAGRAAAIEAPVERSARRRLAAALGLTAIFALALETVGFLPATIVYLFGFGLILGFGLRPRLAVYSVALPVGMWLVFGKLLRVPLPPTPGLG